MQEEHIWCISQKSLLDRLLIHLKANKVHYVYPIPKEIFPEEVIYELKRNYALSDKSIQKVSVLIKGSKEELQKAKEVFNFVTKTRKLVQQLNELYRKS